MYRHIDFTGAMWLIVAILSSGFALTAVSAQEPSDAERAAVLAVVQTFFDAMAAQDVDGARRILVPEGRFFALGEQDGNPTVRSFTNDDYLKRLAGRKQKVRERMWNPEVRIRGRIASVWTPYDFWRDGKFSHCGIDAFDLIKTDDQWRIAGGTFTVEGKCEPSPLGPLKQ
jgi:hypothetical protein